MIKIIDDNFLSGGKFCSYFIRTVFFPCIYEASNEYAMLSCTVFSRLVWNTFFASAKVYYVDEIHITKPLKRKLRAGARANTLWIKKIFINTIPRGRYFYFKQYELFLEIKIHIVNELEAKGFLNYAYLT